MPCVPSFAVIVTSDAVSREPKFDNLNVKGSAFKLFHRDCMVQQSYHVIHGIGHDQWYDNRRSIVCKLQKKGVCVEKGKMINLSKWAWDLVVNWYTGKRKTKKGHMERYGEERKRWDWLKWGQCSKQGETEVERVTMEWMSATLIRAKLLTQLMMMTTTMTTTMKRRTRQRWKFPQGCMRGGYMKSLDATSLRKNANISSS